MSDRPGFRDGQPPERIEMIRRGLVGPWTDTYLRSVIFQRMIDDLAHTMADAADMLAIAGDAVERDARNRPVRYVVVDQASKVTNGVNVVEVSDAALQQLRDQADR